MEYHWVRVHIPLQEISLEASWSFIFFIVFIFFAILIFLCTIVFAHLQFCLVWPVVPTLPLPMLSVGVHVISTLTCNSRSIFGIFLARSISSVRKTHVYTV